MKKIDTNLLIVLSTIGAAVLAFLAATIMALSTFPSNPDQPVIVPQTETLPVVN